MPLPRRFSRPLHEQFSKGDWNDRELLAIGHMCGRQGVGEAENEGWPGGLVGKIPSTPTFRGVRHAQLCIEGGHRTVAKSYGSPYLKEASDKPRYIFRSL